MTDFNKNREFDKYVQYQWTYTPITDTQQKKPICSTVIFVNQGQQTAMIDNQLRILPNQGFTFEGYPGEITTHNFQINFTGVGTKRLLMICKEYPK